MGEPGWSNVQSAFTEYIGNCGETQGSETSQYLKEKKSTEIPQVVASERGIGQTGRSNLSGVVDCIKHCQSLAELHGKADRRA